MKITDIEAFEDAQLMARIAVHNLSNSIPADEIWFAAMQTLKAAYAYLNGTYTSDFNSVCRPPNTSCPNAPSPVLQQFNWGGNSNAFSVGASWTQAMTDNLGLSIGANYHWYKFDTDGTQSFDNYIGGERVGGGSFEGGNLTEKLFTLTASLLYTF